MDARDRHRDARFSRRPSSWSLVGRTWSREKKGVDARPGFIPHQQDAAPATEVFGMLGHSQRLFSVGVRMTSRATSGIVPIQHP